MDDRARADSLGLLEQLIIGALQHDRHPRHANVVVHERRVIPLRKR